MLTGGLQVFITRRSLHLNRLKRELRLKKQIYSDIKQKYWIYVDFIKK